MTRTARSHPSAFIRHVPIFLTFLLAGNNAYAQSVRITTPASGQVFANTATVTIGAQAVTSNAACNHVDLFITVDGLEQIVASFGGGTRNWSGSYSLGLGVHTVQARITVVEVYPPCSGARGSATSSVVSFSLVRQPDVAITSFAPVNGATLNGHAVRATASAASKFGGLAANESLNLAYFLDSLPVLSHSSTSTPLTVDTTFNLPNGRHALKTVATLVNTATGQILDTDIRLSVFTVFAGAACDGGVCEVSDGNSQLVAAAFVEPGIVDDGFGFKQKTPGGLRWTLEGMDVLFAQWHWFRIVGGGRNGEVAVGSFEHFSDGAEDAIVTEDNFAKEIDLKYSGATFPFDTDIRYRLHGGSAGSFTGSVDYDIVATNRTALPLDIEWYVYDDMDLSPTSDRLSAPSTDGSVIKQTTCRIGTHRLYATDTEPMAPDAFNLNMFEGRLVSQGGQPTLLDYLRDGAPTDLAALPNASPDLEVDRVYAKQYHLHLPPFQSESIHGSLSVAAFPRGDLNCNLALDYAGDFPAFLAAFGRPIANGMEPDYNGDGVVGLGDYSIFRSLFH